MPPTILPPTHPPTVLSSLLNSSAVHRTQRHTSKSPNGQKDACIYSYDPPPSHSIISHIHTASATHLISSYALFIKLRNRSLPFFRRSLGKSTSFSKCIRYSTFVVHRNARSTQFMVKCIYALILRSTSSSTSHYYNPFSPPKSTYSFPTLYHPTFPPSVS